MTSSLDQIAPSAGPPTPEMPAQAAPDARALAVSALPGSIRLWVALVAARLTLDRAIDRDSASCPVVGPDVLSVLLPLALAPGHRLRLGDLAECTGLTPSGLTRRIDALVEDGLVARVGCAQDRRGTYAELTEGGLEAVPGALAHHAGVLDRSLAGRLDGSGLELLIALLENLAPTESGRWWRTVAGSVPETALDTSIDLVRPVV